MRKFIFLFLLLVTYSSAKTYSLYLASTKYLDVAKEYYKDIRFTTPSSKELVIIEHEKKNYSLVIRNMVNIEEAKSIQKLFFAQKKYTDSYIKSFNIKPAYKVIEVEKRKTKELKKETLYSHNIENSNDYITASIMYNTGEYEKAYNIFSTLFSKNNANFNVNYFLAKSAVNLKKYDEATMAYERVLIEKPDFNQARYELAKLLYQRKIYDEAKEEFEILLKTNLDEKIKQEIKNYLLLIKSSKNKINGSLNLMLGISRSSNVNGGLLSSEYKLPGLNDILVEGEKPIADTAHIEAVNLNLFNYFESVPIRIRNSFLVFNKSFFNEDDENITLFSYKPTIDYLYKNNLFSLDFSFDRALKNNNEDFFTYSISPRYSNKDFYSFLKYQRVDYQNESQDGKSFDRLQFYSKFNLFDNLNFYTNLYRNSRLEDIRTDIDKFTIANGINLFYNISPKDLVNLNYQFDYSKYKYENIAFDSRREDKKHFLELSYKKTFNNDYVINLSTSYMKNNSNQEAYIYDETAIILNLTKGFVW